MLKKGFYKFFPPPAYLLMPHAGVDVTDDAVRFIQLEEGKENPVIKKYGEVLLPQGVVDGGHIEDPKTLTKILSDIARKNKLSFVRASLPEEKGYLFAVDMQTLNEKEIAESIAFKIEENAPVSAAESIVDHEIMGHTQTTSSVNVTVFPDQVVSSYLRVFHEAGLIPLSFETQASALKRAVIKNGDLNTYVVANIEEKKTGISIISRGFVRFTSTLPIGGEHVTNSFMKSLGLTQEQAFAAKIEKGIEEIKGKKDGMDNAMTAISSIKDELNRVLVYWQTHEEKTQKIDSVILCGHNALIRGLDRYLAIALKKEVRVANVWENLYDFTKTIPAIDRKDSLNYGVAIGLGILHHDI